MIPAPNLNMTDAASSAATATANLQGLTVGGGGYGSTSALPDFLKSRMGGSSSMAGNPYTMPIIAVAALLALVIWKKG